MAVNAGILKAVVSSYRIDTETAFERQRSCIPINSVKTVLALTNHPISFLGLKELSSKYGLGNFDVKLHHMAPQFCLNFGRAMESGASDYTGWNNSELNSMYWNGFGI